MAKLYRRQAQFQLQPHDEDEKVKLLARLIDHSRGVSPEDEVGDIDYARRQMLLDVGRCPETKPGNSFLCLKILPKPRLVISGTLGHTPSGTVPRYLYLRPLEIIDGVVHTSAQPPQASCGAIIRPTPGPTPIIAGSGSQTFDTPDVSQVIISFNSKSTSWCRPTACAPLVYAPG